MNQGKRMYKCPCGKDYLSYPALHTHIKNKHDGVAPGQIDLPNNKMTKRGRPAIQMQKVQLKDEIVEIESLTNLELGILKISEFIKQDIFLEGNQTVEIDLEIFHEHFRVEPREKIYSGIIKFLWQFVNHFNKEMVCKIFEFYSLFFWWCEDFKKKFKLQILNEFIIEGWQSQCVVKQIPYKSNNLKLFKTTLIIMSQWLYLNGYTKQIIQQL